MLRSFEPPFRSHLLVFSLLFTTGLLTAFRYVGGTIGPRIPYFLQRRLLNLIPSSNLQKLAQIVDQLHEKSCEIYNAKKAIALRGEDIHEGMLKDVAQGKDIMSILSKNTMLCFGGALTFTFRRTVRANLEASEEDKLPDHEVTGQLTLVNATRLL